MDWVSWSESVTVSAKKSLTVAVLVPVLSETSLVLGVALPDTTRVTEPANAVAALALFWQVSVTAYPVLPTVTEDGGCVMTTLVQAQWTARRALARRAHVRQANRQSGSREEARTRLLMQMAWFS